MAEYWLSIFKSVDGKPGALVGHFLFNDEDEKPVIPKPPSPAAQFLDDQTVTEEGFETSASELYAGFLLWVQRQRLVPISIQMFGRDMADLGRPSIKRGGRKYYPGIRLLPPKDYASAIEAAVKYVKGQGRAPLSE